MRTPELLSEAADSDDTMRYLFKPEEEFWDAFVETYWNKRPGIFRAITKRPILDDAELMSVLPGAVMSCLLGNSSALRFYVDGRLAEGWPFDSLIHVPPTGHSSQYINNLTRHCGGRSIALIINSFSMHHRELWFRLRAFSSGLIQRVGLPANLTHSGLFCGNYEFTPFAIHFDPSGGFMFAVGGRKTVLVWPPNYFKGRKAKQLGNRILADPREFIDDAIVMSIEPGEAVYWPSSYWHVGYAPDRNAHAAITLGFWDRHKHSSFVARAVEGIITEHLGDADVRTEPWMVSGTPVEISNLATILECAAATGRLRRAIEEQWCRQESAGGFVDLPAYEDTRTLDAEDFVVAQVPIMVRSDGQHSVLVANGRVIPCWRALSSRLIEWLGKVQWASVRTLMNLEPRSASEEIRGILVDLYRVGAIARRRRQSSDSCGPV